MDLALTSRAVLAALVFGALSLSSAGAAPSSAAGSLFAPVLIYHHVKLLLPSDDAIERGLTVLPAQFDAQLSYLTQNRYHTVSAARLVDGVRRGASMPTKPVILTFDDGYSDVYAGVYQELRRRHMTATFFIVPGFLGKPRYLTWAQVVDMARHGMDIEAHSMTHPDLTLVPRTQAVAEISQSRAVLQRRLNRQIRLFAYPYGDYNARILQEVRAAGYLAAFTTHQGWQFARNQLLTLPRVYVDIDDSLSQFAGRLRDDPAVLAQDPT